MAIPTFLKLPRKVKILNKLLKPCLDFHTAVFIGRLFLRILKMKNTINCLLFQDVGVSRYSRYS